MGERKADRDRKAARLGVTRELFPGFACHYDLEELSAANERDRQGSLVQHEGRDRQVAISLRWGFQCAAGQETGNNLARQLTPSSPLSCIRRSFFPFGLERWGAAARPRSARLFGFDATAHRPSITNGVSTSGRLLSPSAALSSASSGSPNSDRGRKNARPLFRSSRAILTICIDGSPGRINLCSQLCADF